MDNTKHTYYIQTHVHIKIYIKYQIYDEYAVFGQDSPYVDLKWITTGSHNIIMNYYLLYTISKN